MTCPITTNAGLEFAKALGVSPSVHEFDCDSIAAIELQAREKAIGDALRAVLGCDLPLGDDLRLSLARSAGINDAAHAVSLLRIADTSPAAPTPADTAGGPSGRR